MREAAGRRQQLELEHEQALAVLSAKQQEIDFLQKVSRAMGVLGDTAGWGLPRSRSFAHLGLSWVDTASFA